jgi:hypothetical protein
MLSVPFDRLRTWAFHDGRIYLYPERMQSKYDQMNDTWGRCVPISVVLREVSNCREYQFSGDHGNFKLITPSQEVA